MSSAGVNAQRVLVIQDAYVDHSVNAIRWAISGLSLQPGDKIKLLRVVQLFDTSSITCGILGNRSKLHSSATVAQRQESIKKETDKKLGEDRNSDKISDILQLTTRQQLEFERAVEAGHSLKVAIVLAAKTFNATSVILDRKSKKDHKYFMDNLKCAILKVKREKSVVYVRRPNAAESDCIAVDRGQSSRHLASDQGEVIFQTSICSICMNPRPHIEPLREFSYSDLHFCTSGFSIGNGPHTRKVFYRGILTDGRHIFVRKHALETITEMEFKSRVQMLGKVRHENVAMLLGSCSHGTEKLLVYEYVCNMKLRFLFYF